MADLDAGGARTVADALAARGGAALAVGVDVADEAQVVALVAEAEATFGPVEVFCANAGIIVPGGVEVPDTEWERMWAVNVQSHIYAARTVLPGMLERHEGYLVHTASAAGLLTQLGSAPYSVTKHAVVALAEWLSITHGDAGIRVVVPVPAGGVDQHDRGRGPGLPPGGRRRPRDGTGCWSRRSSPRRCSRPWPRSGS